MVSHWMFIYLSVCPSFVCPYIHLPVFSFPNNNLSKYHWIFSKIGMCIDIVEICFGIANGKSS